MDSTTFKTALSQFATGICVVTTQTVQGLPYGITINAFSSLSLEPPLVLFCLVKRARIYEHLDQASHYAIHILASDQQPLSAHFSAPGMGGSFSAIDHTIHPQGMPILKDALVTLVCEKHATHDGGDHTIFVGRVLEISRIENQKPLLYFNRGYGSVSS